MKGQIFYYPATNFMSFRTSGIEHMRITSNGSVGIGTTAPSEQLDVAGNIQATGSVKIGGVVAIDSSKTAKRSYYDT